VIPALLYLAQGAEVRILYGIMWAPAPSSTLVSLGLWIMSLCTMAGFVGFVIGRRPSRSAASTPEDHRRPPVIRDEPGAAPTG
jgi:hypothetical protein